MSEHPIRARLLARTRAALEQAWGCALAGVPASGISVRLAQQPGAPLAVHLGAGALLLAQPAWQPAWTELAASLSVEQLFSSYGVFELARATLPAGVSPFGPVWAFLADRQCFRPSRHDAVQELDEQGLRRLSPDLYWHCSVESATRGFAIAADGRIAALATVWQTPEALWEIGVDVLPAGQGQGWGRATVSAATTWILDRAPLAYYTTGAFNIPSCRTARSLGYLHVWSVIKGLKGPFLVPPGPRGRPLPDVIPQPYWREYPEQP